MVIRSLKGRRLSFLLFILLISSPAFATPDRIFSDNNRSVGIVTALDAAKNPLRQGTGFILRRDGVIVTNYHLVSDAKGIMVTVGNTVLKVEGILSADKENDLVILKVAGENLKPVKMGEPDKVALGETVYIMSSTQGFGNLLGIGIVSGMLQMNPSRKIFQIAAPLSEGSTGGPVFNKDGELIGVVTFLIQGAKNLYFAVPASLLGESVTGKKVTPLENAGIEDYRKIPEYWMNLGFYCGTAGLHQEAIDAYTQALRIRPDLAEAFYYLGLSYSALQKYSEAVDAFKQAIRINPHYLEALYNLGVAREDVGLHQEAIETFSQVLKLKPDCAEAYYGLGGAYTNLSRYQDAVDAFRQAVKLKPDYVEAYYNLGVACGLLGRYGEAADACKQALKLKPDLAEAHNNLGVAYLKLNRYEEAMDAYNQALKVRPDYQDARYNLEFTSAKFYSSLKRHAEAVNALQRAIKIKPDSFEAYDTLGSLCTMLGRYQEAADASREAVRIKPDSFDAQSNLAIASGMLNRWSEAADAYREAVRMKPDAAANVYYGLGYACAAVGRYQEAADAYRQALKSKPDYAEAHLGLGIAHVFMNRKDLAREEYEALKKLNEVMAKNLLDFLNKAEEQLKNQNQSSGSPK
ncbi:MAG: tetratricopeptide repeat protein [Proteobacteria bacterium]|nr:tetratricopeptide repeat protein [Pseudomonadota bacterium]